MGRIEEINKDIASLLQDQAVFIEAMNDDMVNNLEEKIKKLQEERARIKPMNDAGPDKDNNLHPLNE